MDIKTQKNATELTITPVGELNAVTTPELAELLKNNLPGIDHLIIDFSDCDYVSSAGLRLLLGTFKDMKKNKGSMQLVNVGENFTEVLVNTGLDAVFDI